MKAEQNKRLFECERQVMKMRNKKVIRILEEVENKNEKMEL